MSKYERVRVHCPNHPFVSVDGRLHRSRLVVEKHYSDYFDWPCYLMPEQVVHHINKVKDDDRIENLKVFPNNSAHSRHHFFDRISDGFSKFSWSGRTVEEQQIAKLKLSRSASKRDALRLKSSKSGRYLRDDGVEGEYVHPRGMLGKNHSEETKRKMSKSLKGKKQSPEHVKKRMASRLITLKKRRVVK